MKALHRVFAATVAASSVAALSGCSIDGVLWGAEGSRVIETTEQVIAGASSGEQSSFACADSVAVFGDAAAWDGLGAGEPEQHDPATSVDGPALDAAWRINLEGVSRAGLEGEAMPTDVFYRETDAGLCVVDVIWQTVDAG